MAAMAVPGISRLNWHLVGAVGSVVTQVIMLLAAVSVQPSLQAAGWLWFASSFAVIGIVYWCIRNRQSPGWWLIWPLLCVVRTFIFGLGDPTAAQLTPGLLTIFFVFAGLTQPPGRSLLLLPPALVVLRSLINLPLHLALVRLGIAAIVWTMASELPARLLRRLSEQQKFLEMTADTDTLTGALNRRGLDDLLERMQGRAYLVIIDLDDFKRYNDTFGHLAGDQLLIDFTSMLHRETRRTDVVVRYGGEEFLVVLPDSDQHRAELVVDRWAEAWKQHSSGVTFSAGVTDLEGDEALRRADDSLYAAKAGGRARTVVALSGAGQGPRS